MTNSKYLSILILISVLFVSTGLKAWSIADGYNGNYLYSMNARSIAMGNTGVFDDYSGGAIFLNPANLTMLPSTKGVQVNGLFTRNDESRSFPLYNSFDTFIDDATYSSNLNVFDDFSLGGFYKVNIRHVNFGFGFHYVPIVNFFGKYDEEVRNNRNSDNDGYPEIIAINKINNKGNINSTGINLSTGSNLSDNMAVHLGISISLLYGRNTSKKSVRWTDWAIAQSVNHPTLQRNMLPDSIFTNEADINGNQIKIGTNWKVNERLGIGCTYIPQTELNRSSDYHIVYKPLGNDNYTGTIDTTRTFDDKYVLPSRFRFGFNYKPQNIMRTWFNAEIEFVEWSKLGSSYEDSWNLFVGVEHKIENRIPLRLGFQAVTDWLTSADFTRLNPDNSPKLNTIKVITPSISSGSCIQIMKNVTLDLGFMYSWREYESLDLFRDSFYNDKRYTGLNSYLLWPNSHIAPTDRGWENPDKIRESFVHITSSLTWNW